MKEKYLTLVTVFICFSMLSLLIYDRTASNKKASEEKTGYVNQSIEEKESFENRMLRWDEEVEMLKDPRTGKIPPGIKEKELIIADKIPEKEESNLGDNFNTYEFIGPYNIGGRTRALASDKYNQNIILAGGVSSGIYRSVDGGISWKNVTPKGEIHNVSCIAQDPRALHSSIWYYGTGEFDFSGSSARFAGTPYPGNGIYKSIDNGVTWVKLPSTNSTLHEFNSPFDYVSKIAVDPNGDVYAASHRIIMRSFDFGANWFAELGEFNPNVTPDLGVTDVAISGDGRVCAAFHGNAGLLFGNPLIPLGGVWYRLGANNWQKIGGKFKLQNPLRDTVKPGDWDTDFRRTILAFAPSNHEVLYVLYKNREDDNTSTGGEYDFTSSNSNMMVLIPKCDFFKFSFVSSPNFWSPNRRDNLPKADNEQALPGNNPFSVQGGYDMALTVSPIDSNTVFIGGTAAFRSHNAFATSSGVRIGGYQNFINYNFYFNHHPDIHIFHFINQDEMLCGSDGGVHKTPGAHDIQVSWLPVNESYITSQYYHVALNPNQINGSYTKNAIGGMQDNGTSEYNGISDPPFHQIIDDADGCAVGISKLDNQNRTFYYYGKQDGKIFRKEVPIGTRTDIKPMNAGPSRFVTYFLLDPEFSNYLYYTAKNQLWRTDNASGVMPNGWTPMTGVSNNLGSDITAMAVARNGEFLYIGTLNGKIWRLENPRTTAAATVPIVIYAGNAQQAISDVSVEVFNFRHVLFTISNYGLQSTIMSTTNADAAAPTWTNQTGDLYNQVLMTTPSIRSCQIVNNGSAIEYYVGTSVGLYSKIFQPNPTIWVREGTQLIRKALVRALDYRVADNGLLVGTHGNGMYFTNILRTISNGFALLPRFSINNINTTHCIEARLYDSTTGEPVTGSQVNFLVKGVNPGAANLMTDINGVARYCYDGNNPGLDTIIVTSGNLSDTVFKMWEMVSPVELTSFSSVIRQRNVTLNWATASEENNSGFDIERRDARRETQDVWKLLHNIKGNGTTNEPTNYTFEDKKLTTGKYKYRLKQIDFNGNFTYYYLSGEVEIGVPKNYRLSQNYPNPFNPVTKIDYELPYDGKVSIIVFDMLGREVAMLVNEVQTAGYYTASFNASNLSSGACFYKIEAKGIGGQEFVDTKKMVVLK